MIQRKVCARCWELTRLWGRTAENPANGPCSSPTSSGAGHRTASRSSGPQALPSQWHLGSQLCAWKGVGGGTASFVEHIGVSQTRVQTPSLAFS